MQKDTLPVCLLVFYFLDSVQCTLLFITQCSCHAFMHTCSCTASRTQSRMYATVFQGQFGRLSGTIFTTDVCLLY